MTSGKLLRPWILAVVAGAEGCMPAPAPPPTPTIASAPAAAPTAAIASADVALQPPAAEAPPPERPLVRPPDTKGMVLLPGGTFHVKHLRKTATVASFWLDVTEVTAGAYRACVVAGKCTEEGLACDQIHPVDTDRRPGKENHPINCVNQAQAIAYCAFVGKRLPTGAEWEWAARGTTRGSTYPWGEAAPDKQVCWKRIDDNHPYRSKGTCQVHSFPRGDSPQGIADLAGNVAEWSERPVDGYAPIKGGDWMEVNPGLVAADVGGPYRAAAHLPGVGFRCAGDEPAASP